MELFVNVLDIDPAKPPFWQAISTPFAFSAELARANGPFETYGWPTATMPLKDEVVAPELLMEDVEFTLSWQEKLAYSSLARDDWKVMMSVFSVTDRVQHMMYQYFDEQHPLYDAAEAAKTFTFFGKTISRHEAIPAVYQQMDRVLGVVLNEHLGPRDTLLVCSDHGFQTFHYQVHVNNWLAERGYLKLKSPLLPGRSGNDDTLQFVDWSGTRAYCVGLGFIYLNLKGREPQGIVEPSEADALLAELKADLLSYEDEKTGLKVCKEAYIVKEIHSGPYLKEEADLLCGFAPGYRVSWGTTLGGLSIATDESGAGILGRSSRRATRPGPATTSRWPLGGPGRVLLEPQVRRPGGGFKLLHIAPTVLALSGVPVPSAMDLRRSRCGDPRARAGRAASADAGRRSAAARRRARGGGARARPPRRGAAHPARGPRPARRRARPRRAHGLHLPPRHAQRGRGGAAPPAWLRDPLQSRGRRGPLGARGGPVDAPVLNGAPAPWSSKAKPRRPPPGPCPRWPGSSRW
jgi:hypothetical protein